MQNFQFCQTFLKYFFFKKLFLFLKIPDFATMPARGTDVHDFHTKVVLAILTPFFKLFSFILYSWFENPVTFLLYFVFQALFLYFYFQNAYFAYLWQRIILFLGFVFLLIMAIIQSKICQI